LARALAARIKAAGVKLDVKVVKGGFNALSELKDAGSAALFGSK